ncbi:hypothetical protein ACS3SW_05320 [Roseobacteraceae bacterium S113]
MLEGLIKSLRRRLAPQLQSGFAFKLRAEFSVAEIYGEKQQAGMEAVIAVRGRDLETAKTQALEAARKLAPGTSVSIIAMKAAYDRDFEPGQDINILEQESFGQSKHGRF